MGTIPVSRRTLHPPGTRKRNIHHGAGTVPDAGAVAFCHPKAQKPRPVKGIMERGGHCDRGGIGPWRSTSGEGRRPGRTASGLPMAPFRRQADTKGADNVTATQGQRIEQSDGNDKQCGKRRWLIAIAIPITLALGESPDYRRVGTPTGKTGCRPVFPRGGIRIGDEGAIAPGRLASLDKRDQKQQCEEPIGPAAHHVVCRLHQPALWPDRLRHSHSVAANTMPFRPKGVLFCPHAYVTVDRRGIGGKIITSRGADT